jgi:hypothetical protein
LHISKNSFKIKEGRYLLGIPVKYVLAVAMLTTRIVPTEIRSYVRVVVILMMQMLMLLRTFETGVYGSCCKVRDKKKIA